MKISRHRRTTETAVESNMRHGRYTPASAGESERWSSIVSTAEENRQNFCKVINGMNLFSALYGTYTVLLHELKAMLKASTPADQSKTPMSVATQENGFKENRRRKRHSTNETAPTSKKAVCTPQGGHHPELLHPAPRI
jgi:hypothetical protein